MLTCKWFFSFFLIQFLSHTFSFIDRDMFMCYHGGGVGHCAVQEVTNIFLNDRPTEELCTRAKTTTTQDNDPATEHTSEEEGEDNDKDREMAGTHTILINPDEIPDGDEFRGRTK